MGRRFANYTHYITEGQPHNRDDLQKLYDETLGFAIATVGSACYWIDVQPLKIEFVNALRVLALDGIEGVDYGGIENLLRVASRKNWSDPRDLRKVIAEYEKTVQIATCGMQEAKQVI